MTPQALQVLTSIPESRIIGAELELAAKPAERLGLRVGASYLDAEYRKGVVQGVDVSGNVLNLAPKWTLNASLDWTVYASSAFSITLHEDSRYTSRQFFNAFNSPELVQDAFWLHNARLTFKMSAFSLTAWVTNLADEKYLAYTDNTAPLFNFNLSQRGKPRQYGVEAGYRF